MEDTTATQTHDAQAHGARRKFTAPPVKLACLSCRASRTRCNGGHPCTSCTTKGHECVYRPSRRGGPRFRKRETATPQPVQDEVPAVFPPDQPIAVQNFIDPGAALGQLPDTAQDSDYLFDSLFPNSFLGGVFDGVDLTPDILAVPQKSGPLVRTYRGDRSLLQAYYCWIHPYIPIFPPPETSPPVDEPYPVSQNQPLGATGGVVDFEPSTPVALALSAVLALIPCAEDTDPSGAESQLFRRKWAQFFAQAAIECIEAEAELPDSATEPHKALEASSATPPPVDRAPFHPRVPTELESIIALDLLSVYEYAQRGNIKKMRLRAGQALVDAMMTHSLHAQMDSDDNDFFAEARRRIWWMTYVCATQSSIVSNTPPPLELYGAMFSTKFPTLDIDPEAWPIFIEAQQSILTATQFVIELNKVLANHGDMEPIYAKMVELETRFAPLVDRSEAWALTGNLAPPVDPAETCLVLSLRSMARIKLNSARIKIHRYCAFYDLPVFSGRHCDLKSASAPTSDGYEPLRWSCSCGGSLSINLPPTQAKSELDLTPAAHSAHSTASSTSFRMSPASTTPSTHLSSSTGSPQTSRAGSTSTTAASSGAGAAAATTMMPTPTARISVPPFSSHQSAKICLRSAANIANGFDRLPYPNPLGRLGQDSCFLSPTSLIVAPRMLPSYTCCAMQAAYVFLSVYRKTMALQGPLAGSSSSGTDEARHQLAGMLLQLQRGLTSILAALENYATAFEALRSMRDQIRLAAEQLMGSSF